MDSTGVSRKKSLVQTTVEPSGFVTFQPLSPREYWILPPTALASSFLALISGCGCWAPGTPICTFTTPLTRGWLFAETGVDF